MGKIPFSPHPDSAAHSLFRPPPEKKHLIFLPMALFPRLLLLLPLLLLLASCASSQRTSADYYDGPPPAFVNGQVVAPKRAPKSVHRAVAAANAIQSAPYQYGGGHGRASSGLDCSGSVSYVLRESGLLQSSLPSSAFRKYGRSGEGKWITVFARPGHVFMTICGLRLDTSSRGGGIGPRWSTKPRLTKGFKIRHPAGL